MLVSPKPVRPLPSPNLSVPTNRLASSTHKPFRIISFADLHPLTPIESNLSEKPGRAPLLSSPPRQSNPSRKLFRMIFLDDTSPLNTIESYSYRNHRGGTSSGPNLLPSFSTSTLRCARTLALATPIPSMRYFTIRCMPGGWVYLPVFRVSCFEFRSPARSDRRSALLTAHYSLLTIHYPLLTFPLPYYPSLSPHS
jgi:hypothetical protein